jgi:branched-chain amino acid transport system permease protein
MGTVFGPIAGAALLVSIESYLAQLSGWVIIVQGLIYIVCVLSFRRGLVGEAGRLLRRPL